MATVKTDVVMSSAGERLKGLVSSRFSTSETIKKGIFSDKFTFTSFFICLVLLIIQCGTIALYWKKLPPEIPIFYSMPWGSQMLGRTAFIWLIPFLNLILTLFNLSLAITILKGNKFLSTVLVSTCLLIGFIAFYSVIKTVTLLSP